MPEYLIPLGRTVGLPMNGAVSNLGLSSQAVGTLGRELRNGGYDVVHVHEPNAPFVSWFATEAARTPLVGTFHCYSRNPFSNGFAANVAGARRLFNKLHVRIAVSEAARWTCERFYGGSYRIVPNGVDLAAARPAHANGRHALEILFVGRAEARKGLPVLLRAFEALRGAGIEARLTVAGATDEEVAPLLLDPEGVHVAGRVSDEEKWRLLGESDLLCAPSLGGESFGMVLTEAFASATPVVASDIAGYRDVVRHGVDGLLVPAADPAALGEALCELALAPDRRATMSAAARERAQRFSWPRVADEVLDAYADAVEMPAPATRPERAKARLGLVTADPGPVIRPKRLPSIEPDAPPARRRTAVRVARRAAVLGAAAAGIGLAAMALEHIGIQSIGRAVVAATPVWVLTAFALMCASMLLRAESWHAILRAALPGTRVRRRDAARATMIGVLMSATLPARLGEPSRALIMARRVGRVRDRLPVVLGTLVSQTLLNILALVVLGTMMFATVGIFRGGEDALVFATLAPVGADRRSRSRSRVPSAWQAVALRASAAGPCAGPVRDGPGPQRAGGLPPAAARWMGRADAAQRLGGPAAGVLLLLVALGLDGRAGIGAAAAVLFAVNVTAALPATPSNLGVFQAACVAVLSAYGVGKTDALAYGIILQAVEIGTALAMGMPALVREGMTWKDLRLRALHATPVELRRARTREPAEVEG